MMSSIIAMLAVVIFVFFIARRNKSYRAFVNLLIPVCLGFIVGMTVQKYYNKKSNNISTVITHETLTDTTMCPTLHCFSPAVVLTDENNDSVMSQEKNTKRDSVSANVERIPTGNEQTEIIDDS